MQTVIRLRFSYSYKPALSPEIDPLQFDQPTVEEVQKGEEWSATVKVNQKLLESHIGRETLEQISSAFKSDDTHSLSWMDFVAAVGLDKAEQARAKEEEEAKKAKADQRIMSARTHTLRAAEVSAAEAAELAENSVNRAVFVTRGRC